MSFRAIFSCVLAVALVYQPTGAVPTAPVLGQVAVRGQAKVNGKLVPSGVTVFPGDEVAVGTGGVAELQLSGGGKVLLPAASSVVLSTEAEHIVVTIKQGAVALLSNSRSRAVLEASGARIKPESGSPVVLEVAAGENSVKILARRGSATLETVNKSLKVEEGSELDATLVSPESQGPAGVGTIPTGRSWLGSWVFITAIASGLTGLVLGITAASRPNPADCKFVSTTGKIKCP